MLAVEPDERLDSRSKMGCCRNMINLEQTGCPVLLLAADVTS